MHCKAFTTFLDARKAFDTVWRILAYFVKLGLSGDACMGYIVFLVSPS